MKTEFTDVSATQKTITIEIPTDVVSAEINRVARGYTKQARIPGFRPGKVPTSLVKKRFKEQIAQGAQLILTTGGTGIAKRDGTIDVVRRLLTIELEGFGELFRMLSFQQVQAAAMMSRAAGGLVIREPSRGGDTLLFSMPGSPNAVELAMSQLRAPQLAHLVWERKR